MHRLTARILDVSNEFQNINVPIHERVCISPPPYYLDWFERSNHNAPLNQDDDPFFFNLSRKFKEQNHLEENLIESLIHWSQLLNIRKAQLIMIYTSKYSLI